MPFTAFEYKTYMTVCIAPRYARQTAHVAANLPRLPHELDVWQFIIRGSENEVYRVPINIDHVVQALRWLKLNNPLCIDICPKMSTPQHTLSHRSACQCTTTSSSAQSTNVV